MGAQECPRLYLNQYRSLKTQGTVNFAGYTLDRARWQLRWGEEPVVLTRKTFDLLLYLIDHHDQVVGKDELLTSLWPKQVVEEGNLNQQVFLLRKALSRHGPEKIVETVPGRGYRFAAELESQTWEDEVSTVVIHDRHSITTVTVDESVEDEPVEPTTPSASRSAGASTNASASPTPATTSTARRATNDLRSSLDWVVISALLCALGALGVLGWHFWQNHSTGEPVEVVLTDLVGTGDVGLDRALDQALRVDLSQSPFVTVMSSSQVRATLANMKQPENALLTLPLAREVCERTSAQVMLQTAVSKFGQHYMITLVASNCAAEPAARGESPRGEILAQAKQEAQQLDDLPHALGVVAADIRKSLGESRASIRRFDKPLRAASTNSLAALKAYSEAYQLAMTGDWVGTIPLLQHALELNPQFALAYFDLAASYDNLNGKQKERAALIKAYELRDTVPEVEQFLITALYHDTVTGDTEKSIETYKTWAALYPRSAEAFGNLAEEYDSVGQADLGVAPAKRAVELRPNDTAAYQNLIRTQLHSGQLEAAQRTCELAISKNLDGAGIRHLLLQSMYARHDAKGVASQLDWGRNHADALLLHIDEISLALSKGEMQRANELLTQLRAREYPPALGAQYQSGLVSIARALAEAGFTSDSRELLKSVPTAIQDRNAPVALAENGDVAQADEALQSLARDHGQETLWKAERLPEIRSAILLAKHEPEQAVRALEPSVPFDRLTFGPAYLRGAAWLTLGKPELAQTEFHKITDHVYIDPLSNEYPLALLASARAYILQSQTDNARVQLERLFDIWKNADAEWPLLQAAHAEYDSNTAVDVTLRPD